MKANPEWIGTCVNLRREDLEAYDATERSVGYRTFLRHVGGAVVKVMDAVLGVPLREDYAVSFGVGKWKGRRAVCLHHSAIHHLWYIKGGRNDAD